MSLSVQEREGVDFRFEAEAHRYTINGRAIPSVTQVLDHFRPPPPIDPERFEALGNLGTAVHRACELDDQNRLDEASVADEVAPYLAGYRQFRASIDGEVIVNEQPMCDTLHRFAGTPDRLIIINGVRTLLDIKTGTRSVWHELQTAAYAHLCRSIMPAREPVEARAALYLDWTRPTGFDYIPHKNPEDWAAFAGLLRAYHRLKTD